MNIDVLSDGPIQKVEDLKGKVLATNAFGSGVDVAMRAMLRKHGLEANRDYTVIEAPFPAMRAMLAEKKVDMIPAVLPFSLDPELQEDIENAVHHGRCGRRDAIRHVVSAQALHRPHRAELVDFLEDSLRISHWYTDPRITTRSPRSPRRSPSSRRSGSAGSTPSRIIFAIPRCCRMWMPCRGTSI